MDDLFQYDAAFSFLAQDESLAIALNDLLQNRFKTFLYSEKQNVLAGTDGEKTFNRVFGKETRLVVILYRKGWGESPWTRIEETAIRNRAHDHGYDFTILIPLDNSNGVPEWFPKNRIWADIKRWGLEGTAAVIEARIQELGGSAHEETVQERAERLRRSRAFQQERKQFLQSKEGVETASKEFRAFHDELSLQVSEIQQHLPIQLKTKQGRNGQKDPIITGMQYSISICWQYRYNNSLNDSRLLIELWDPYPPIPRAVYFHPPHQLAVRELLFDMVSSGEYRWIEKTVDKRAYSSQDLASYCLKLYMDRQEQEAPL